MSKKNSSVIFRTTAEIHQIIVSPKTWADKTFPLPFHIKGRKFESAAEYMEFVLLAVSKMSVKEFDLWALNHNPFPAEKHPEELYDE